MRTAKMGLILLIALVGFCFSANKYVMDQSVTIHKTYAHYDTVWTDGVKSAVFVPASIDTSSPVLGWSQTYHCTDTSISMDTSWNFFCYITRKKGASEVFLDTVKIKKMQPKSDIFTKVLITPNP